MGELREFAQHKAEFEALNAELVAIGPDDPVHAKKVWEGPANKAFTILMDPELKVIDAYGFKGTDGVKRSIAVVDENGNEIYRQSTDGIDESKLPGKILTLLKKPQ